MNEKIKKALSDTASKINHSHSQVINAKEKTPKEAANTLNNVKKSLTDTIKTLDDITKVLQEG